MYPEDFGMVKYHDQMLTTNKCYLTNMDIDLATRFYTGASPSYPVAPLNRMLQFSQPRPPISESIRNAHESTA